jgi:hypothetical protein
MESFAEFLEFATFSWFAKFAGLRLHGLSTLARNCSICQCDLPEYFPVSIAQASEAATSPCSIISYSGVMELLVRVLVTSSL